MASSIEEFINRTATNINKGIKEKIEDGSFNRLGEGLGEGVNSIAAGMVRFIGMAKDAFSKLNEKAEAIGKPKATQATGDVPPPPPAPLQTPPPPFVASNQQEIVNKQPTPADDFITRLATEYELEDQEVSLFSMARLTAQTGLFFANSDGNYSIHERQCIQDFQRMITDNVDGVNRDALKHIFDNIEYPYTLDEILQMTHALVDGMEREERENVINNLDDFINQVMESGIQEGTQEASYYQCWCQEFGKGEPQAIFCGQCGQKNPADALFCCTCGTRLR